MTAVVAEVVETGVVENVEVVEVAEGTEIVSVVAIDLFVVVVVVGCYHIEIGSFADNTYDTFPVNMLGSLD